MQNIIMFGLFNKVLKTGFIMENTTFFHISISFNVTYK